MQEASRYIEIFLLSSDIRSEGRIAIIKKFDLLFVWHSILWGELKKKLAGGLGTETSTCLSEVLALVIEALVPLRHKAVNGCLVKLPGAALWTSSARTAWRRRQRWIAWPSEPSFGEQKGRNCRERGLGSMEGYRVGRLTHACASFWSRDLHPWPTSGGQRTTALFSEQLFDTHTTILLPVCTFQTPTSFFFNASGSFLFECPLYITSIS